MPRLRPSLLMRPQHQIADFRQQAQHAGNDRGIEDDHCLTAGRLKAARTIVVFALLRGP